MNRGEVITPVVKFAGARLEAQGVAREMETRFNAGYRDGRQIPATGAASSSVLTRRQMDF
ncbi:MAG TPA: hypothetical protein VNJ52_14185 [Patescibacteria group bacterium]|nr:hypothetical protein [Patescibacteria group bacterium]